MRLRYFFSGAKRLLPFLIFLTGCQLLPGAAKQPIPTPIIPAVLPAASVAAPLPETAVAPLPPAPLEIHLANQLAGDTAVSRPAQAAYQLVGRGIDKVAMAAGQTEADGRQRALAWESLPGPWPDGAREGEIRWTPQAAYLSDYAENGDFVLTQAGALGATAVSGQFIFAGGGAPAAATLLFDVTGQLTQIQASQDIRPRFGDQFQPERCYYRDGLACEPGVLLQFDDAGQLRLETRPLPDGRYALGLYAANQSGASAEAFTGVTVAGNHLVDGRLYRDPGLRFQFTYPDAWLPPLAEAGSVIMNSAQGDGQIRLTILPDLPRQSTAVSLQREVLNRFGRVDILHEGERLVGGMKAMETAYGYTDEAGREHSGIFYAFVSNEGDGYSLDVDGLRENEAALVETAVTLADSWQFLQAQTEPGPDWWPAAEFAGYALAHPPNFTAQQAGDWLRFSSGPQTFLALRLFPGGNSAEIVNDLADEAGRGMAEFQVSPPAPVSLDDFTWQRSDFSYVSGDGRPVSGFLMARRAGVEAVGVQILLAHHVVGDKSGAGHDVTGPFPGRRRQADRQAVPIHHAEVAGIVRRARLRHKRRGTAAVQGLPHLFGVQGDKLVIQKAGDGLGQGQRFALLCPEGAGAIGGDHNLVQKAQVVGGTARQAAHVKMGQKFEGESGQDAAGGAGRRQQYLVPAVGQADGVGADNLVLGQIVRGEQAAVFCLIPPDGLGQTAAPDELFSFYGQRFQRVGQVGDVEMFARLNHTAVFQEDFPHSGRVGVKRSEQSAGFRLEGFNGDAVPRQLDGRLQ